MKTVIEILILIFFIIDCISTVSSYFKINKVIKMDTEKRVEQLRKHSYNLFYSDSIDLDKAIEIVRKGSIPD